MVMKSINKTIKLDGGYIGLITLLISVSIIAFVMIRSDLFTANKDGKNTIEQGRGAIDQASAAKKIIEQNSRKAIEE